MLAAGALNLGFGQPPRKILPASICSALRRPGQRDAGERRPEFDVTPGVATWGTDKSHRHYL